MTDSESSDLCNEALRKIGRNMVNLQTMERALKILIAQSEWKGPDSDLRDIYEKKCEEIERRTMGQLSKQLVDLLYSAVDSNPADRNASDLPWTSFSYRLDGGDEQKFAEQRAFKLVVEERNQLVHQMLGDFDSGSVESCRTLISALDRQAERLHPQFERVTCWLTSLNDGRNAVIAVLRAELMSDKGNESDGAALL
ncbi:MAG: hypothetical protein JWM11_7975 [Planctomycetaceae bacterium]|nr:hypothetical protein [Planctomycetaceae bacterium]